MPHEFLIRSKLDRVFKFLEMGIRHDAAAAVVDDNKYIPFAVATDLIPYAYAGLIKSIMALGYKPNQNFWVFPYDWRQSNRLSGQLLSRFIEKVSMGDGNPDGVDIVSHSMGGIITRTAQKYGAPIKRTVFIGCPHTGSPLAYFILHPEIDSRRFIGSAYDTYSADATLIGKDTGTDEPKHTLYRRRKELFAKFPSMYELLPDELYLRKQPILYADGKPAFGVEATYLEGDWAFKDENMRAAVRDAVTFKAEIGSKLQGECLSICGTNHVTFDSIRYKAAYHTSVAERRPSYVMQRGFSLPYDSGLGGDGYVPIESAMAAPLVSEANKPQNSVFLSESHTTLPNARATAEAIARFLSM
ncbi:MAG TPA: hypothetical protein VJP79_09830 [Nitrososphaera sp.]|nr:hypothetical protein [Nitrososphaera sp.]